MTKVFTVFIVAFMVITLLPLAGYSDAPVTQMNVVSEEKAMMATKPQVEAQVTGKKAKTKEPQLTDAQYEANTKATLDRGYRNVLASPWEVVLGVQDNCKEGTIPVVNVLWGFGVGTLKGLRRLGSGAWDLVAAWIPNEQQGMPCDPEVL